MFKKKIDNKSKFDSMVGYSDDGIVSAVEPGWRIKPEALAKLLVDRFPTKEDAKKLVNSAILVPVFKREDYEGVDGYGDVVESHLSWYKENTRKHVGHLFLFMKGTWHYSNNAVDWDPVAEVFEDNSGLKFDGVRDALDLQDSLVKEVA
jgi:hypothetical protein